ncbi:MAG: hypothetical protein WC029_01030 [Sulfuricella sp.]|jgi:hypothetical protein
MPQDPKKIFYETLGVMRYRQIVEISLLKPKTAVKAAFCAVFPAFRGVICGRELSRHDYSTGEKYVSC